MVGWHHRRNGCEFEQALGVADGQGSLMCCSPWMGSQKSDTTERLNPNLSDFTFTFHFLALEKEMATHSSVLAWKIPRMEKPGRLQPMGLQRVGHD